MTPLSFKFILEVLQNTGSKALSSYLQTHRQTERKIEGDRRAVVASFYLSSPKQDQHPSSSHLQLVKPKQVVDEALDRNQRPPSPPTLTKSATSVYLPLPSRRFLGDHIGDFSATAHIPATRTPMSSTGATWMLASSKPIGERAAAGEEDSSDFVYFKLKLAGSVCNSHVDANWFDSPELHK
ncbi:hypothetical protein LXL04_003141 [Taraxacum kok-saghyz]